MTIFDWDENQGKVIITQSKRTWITVLVTVAYLVGQAAFEIRQLRHLAGDPKESMENYMKLVVQFATRLMSVLIQIESMMYGESAAEFANEILRLNKKFKGRFFNVFFQFVLSIVTTRPSAKQQAG